MFGYVLPCKMELKLKDYELFRSYYCGLCVAIKKNFGQIPRSVLNYDLTFLAILLDSFEKDSREFVHNRCIMHPLKKRIKVINNKSLDYASYCNVLLAYYKLLDDKEDEGSFKSRTFSSILKPYIKKIPSHYDELSKDIKDNLEKLNALEKSGFNDNIDEISHPFSHITGIILSHYHKDKDFNENLYWLGYNLGKWIYIIDAWDDLKEDMEKDEYNPINSVFNKENKPFDDFSKDIYKRIENLLLQCGYSCTVHLRELPLEKNQELLDNILHLGLIEKIDSVMGKSDKKDFNIDFSD